MSSMFVIPIACVTALLAAQGRVAEGRFPYEPFDEATDAPELLAARSALIAAIVRHDVEAVARFVAPDLNGTAGSREGWLAEFRRSPDVLRDLVSVLALGGGFVNAEKRRFCAPYWYVKPPQGLPYPDSLQPPEGYPWMVLWPNLPVYERADPQSRIVGRLGLELVRPAGSLDTTPTSRGGARETAAIEMAAIIFNAKVGYVDRRAIRNPDDSGDYACFEQRDGDWLLSAFDRY